MEIELINLIDYRWIESNEILLFRGFVRHFHNRNSLESERSHYALTGMIDKDGVDNLIRATNNSIYLIIYK